MSAYVIVDIDIKDPARYEEYRRLAPASITRYGGRYLVRGGRTEVFEGKWEPKRVVVLEFSTIERARAWLESAEYAEARAIRQSCSDAVMVAVAGVEPESSGDRHLLHSPMFL